MNDTNPQRDDIDVNEIRERLMNVKATENLSWPQISNPSDIPQGTVSQFGAGTYQGDNKKVAKKVLRWLDSRNSAAAIQSTLPAMPDYAPTSVSAEIISVLTYARATAGFNVVIGAPGIGKSFTFNHFARTTPNCWVITLTPAVKSIYSLMTLLADSLQIIERNPALFSKRIHDFFEHRQGLLIVDEANFATIDILEQLRSFRDTSNVGVVLGGSTEIWGKITGGGNRKHAQLASRVGMRLNKGKSTVADISALLNAWEIEDTDQRKFLTAIAKKPGSLRNLCETTRLAKVFANGNGTELTLENIERAWAQLSTEVSAS